MEAPYVRDWEEQKSPIRDDVGHRITNKESVDVHGTRRVCRLVPLRDCSVSASLSEHSLE